MLMPIRAALAVVIVFPNVALLLPRPFPPGAL